MTEGLLSLGIEDLGLGLSGANIDRLELFLQEMARWNRVHNLTAIEDQKDSVVLHLIDSIAVLPIMDQFLGNKAVAIADLGSGGGLPAIPLAIAKRRPGEFDAVISRAFTSLANFLELSLPLLKPDGLVFAMKAKRADEELQEVSLDQWRLIADEPLQIPKLKVERRLLVLTPMRKSPI